MMFTHITCWLKAVLMYLGRGFQRLGAVMVKALSAPPGLVLSPLGDQKEI